MLTGKWKILKKYFSSFRRKEIIMMADIELKKNPKHISDEIGQEYREWKAGDMVFIKAPTGSGKSYFILHIFLKYIIESGSKLLYLVNRRVLQEQLQEELDNDIYDEVISCFGRHIDLKRYIQIFTYQYLESRIKGGILHTVNELQEYSHVVCDECHYFYADSNFNTNTELSFDCIRREFDCKVQIYMSATIDGLKEAYMKREPKYFEFGVEEFPIVAQSKIYGIRQDWVKDYSAAENYDYINLYEFQDLKDLHRLIISAIEKSSEKWLVFVDSIDYGRKIEKSLLELDGQECLNRDNIVFIDADYDKNEEAKKSVRQIVKEKCAKKQIIISTAVMDNGVSFHDLELRNIVILVDTKESFLQMLGRKRKDERRVNLYICQRDIAYFQRRLRYVENIITVFQKNLIGLEKMYQRFKNMNNEEKMTLNPYTDYYYRKKGVTLASGGKVYQAPYCLDYDSILEGQQMVLDKIISSDFICNNVRKLCYSVGGVLTVNDFSVLRSDNLKKFYKEMIARLNNDPRAFVKEQASWLSLSESSVHKVLEGAEEEKCKRYRKRLMEGIEALTDEIDKDGNIAFKKEYKNELIYFLQKNENMPESAKESAIKSVKKTDRALTAEQFNTCMQAAKLKYDMEGSNPYTIKKI